MKKEILMDIDFDARIATLYGFNENPIIRSIKNDKIYTNMWNIYYYFDVPIGINGEKWTFSWSQWAKKEQFFKLEQYVPFPKDENIINLFVRRSFAEHLWSWIEDNASRL